ncbi:MAG TPA: IS110 family transposase [Polyangiaceae bacterium]
MDHVAIDLGGRESQICVRSAEGEILLEERRATRGLKAFLANRPGKSRVVLETCSEAFGVAESAREAGHEVVVVPASLVRSLGVGSRGLKTDVRDARNLAEASCRMSRLPSVHIPSETSRQRKSICGLREVLVATKTKLINAVRGWMRTWGLGTMQGGTAATFAKRLRDRAAKQGVAIPAAVERLLVTLQTVLLQLDEADVELKQLAKDDPVCRRLMTVPGIGPVSSLRFAAAIDDVSRFENAASLQSYLGLVPGESSSSDRRRLTSITKAGAPEVRWALVQAAWSARRYRRKDPMVAWAAQIEARRGKCIAIVALARKLAGIMFAVWRDETSYDPGRGARPAPTIS